MADMLSPIISRLMDFGFFDIIIFVLVAAVIFAFLKKSKIAGDSPVAIGAISLSIGFMVLVFRFITGTSLVAPISILFTQWTTVFLFLIFGFLAASLFYPDMIKWLPQVFHSRSTLMVMIVLGITLMITSGLVQTFFATTSVPSTPGTPAIPQDIIIFSAGIIIFIVLVIIAGSVGMGGVK